MRRPFLVIIIEFAFIHRPQFPMPLLLPTSPRPSQTLPLHLLNTSSSHLPKHPCTSPTVLGWSWILWRWPAGGYSPNCPVGGERRGLHDRLHSQPLVRRPVHGTCSRQLTKPRRRRNGSVYGVAAGNGRGAVVGASWPPRRGRAR